MAVRVACVQLVLAALAQSIRCVDTSIVGRRLGCIVTGGTRGLGAAIVRELVGRGHRVMFTGSQPPPRPMDSMEERAGAVYCQLDMRYARQPDFDALVEHARRVLGVSVLALVNNAAVCERGSSPDVLSRALRVNALSAIGLLRSALPGMRNAGYGRVINVSSGDGELVYLHSTVRDQLLACSTVQELERCVHSLVRTFDQQLEYAHGPTPAYSVSKAVLNRATRLLAAEEGDDSSILINAVCPGDVATDMLSDGVSPGEVLTPSVAARHVLDALYPDAMPSGGPAGASHDTSHPRYHNGCFLRFGEELPW